MSLLGHALLLEVGLEDLVGGARVDIVRTRQHPAFDADLVHQVVDRRDGLLIGRRPGVEDVLRGLLTLVLNGVEEQAVELLEHRQHGLARDRGPAAEHRRDLLLLDQLAGLLGEQRPVGGRVHDHRLELLAQHAALLVLLIDQHEHGVFQRRLADGHGAGQRVQYADLDGIRRRQGTGQAQTDPGAQADDRLLDEVAFGHAIHSR